MSPKSKKELYQTGIGGLILSVVLFIICLIAHKVTGYWTLCVGLAVASLLSIAGGCPINFMNSIKPSVKKTIYNISFFIVIASVVAYIGAIRYASMMEFDLDSAARVCVAGGSISLIVLVLFRRCKDEWIQDK